jgi:branched-subunit amino acid ABC-type transport system permease component
MGETAMGSIAVFLAAVLGGASALFYTAAGNRHVGNTWELSVCSTAGKFCDHPEWPAIAAISIVALALVVKFAATVRG